jgi:hypothetical protein
VEKPDLLRLFLFGLALASTDSGFKTGKKNPACAGSFAAALIRKLGSLDVGSLLAFRALRDFELDFLTFFKRLEAVHLDCGEVRKQIFTAVIRGDKAEAFRVVEPLDGTCCHKKRLSILTNHTSRKSKKPRVTLPPLKTCSLLY